MQQVLKLQPEHTQAKLGLAIALDEIGMWKVRKAGAPHSWVGAFHASCCGGAQRLVLSCLQEALNVFQSVSMDQFDAEAMFTVGKLLFIRQARAAASLPCRSARWWCACVVARHSTESLRQN